MPQTVDIGERSLSDYRGIAPDATLDELVRLAENLRGARVLHLNATPYGGVSLSYSAPEFRSSTTWAFAVGVGIAVAGAILALVLIRGADSRRHIVGALGQEGAQAEAAEAICCCRASSFGGCHVPRVRGVPAGRRGAWGARPFKSNDTSRLTDATRPRRSPSCCPRAG